MCVLGCGTPQPERGGVARIEDLVVHDPVVQELAVRDGVDEATARERALDTLRLVAASRQDRASAAGEPVPELSDARLAHLERSALARLWLATEFEPRHRAEDIPTDDPLLVRARGTAAWVHPLVHRVCQAIVVPAEGHDASLAKDPAWREEAQAIATRMHARLVRHVPPADTEACKLVAKNVALSDGSPGPRHALRFEGEVGFDLDACAEPREGGGCDRAALDADWTAAVRALSAPVFSDPFATQFGVHVVLLTAVEPARALDDPATDAFLREQVHRRWQTEAFERELQRLAEKRAVRFADPGEGGS